MPRITKRLVEQVETKTNDYFIWDESLPGSGLRVFSTGRRSYVMQYRAKGRTRRFTLGLHGVWTPETAHKEASILLGRVAQGENPAEERQLDHEAITVKELCIRYLEGAKAGLILGEKRRPKKDSTIYVDGRAGGRSHRSRGAGAAPPRSCGARGGFQGSARAVMRGRCSTGLRLPSASTSGALSKSAMVEITGAGSTLPCATQSSAVATLGPPRPRPV